jgi:hypothetical protein
MVPPNVRSNEGVERLDLTRVHGKDRLTTWRNRWDQGPFVTHVCVGTLDDGRWFAERYGRAASARDKREGAAVYAGPHAEHYARATARRWMRTVGGEWVEA